MGIEVEMDSLVSALFDRSRDRQYFLDSETGDILEFDIPDKSGFSEGDRYIPISPVFPWERYRYMEDFIGTVEDPGLWERLEVAKEGRNPLRQFERILRDFPEEWNRWREFEASRMVQYAGRWLAFHGIGG